MTLKRLSSRGLTPIHDEMRPTATVLAYADGDLL